MPEPDRTTCPDCSRPIATSYDEGIHNTGECGCAKSRALCWRRWTASDECVSESPYAPSTFLVVEIDRLRRRAAAWKALAKVLHGDEMHYRLDEGGQRYRVAASRSAGMEVALRHEIANRDAHIELLKRQREIVPCPDAAVDGVHCGRCAGLSVARTMEIERLREQVRSARRVLEDAITIAKNEVVACGRRRMLLRAVLRERIEIAKSLRLFAASYRRSAKSYARQYAYSIAAEFAQRAEDFDRVANLVERR